jgi:hypothetical protein
MRNKVNTALIIISLLMSVGMVSAHAQIGDSRVETDVPFQFIVGRTTLPAGKYEILNPGEFSPSVLEIRSLDGRSAVLFTTGSVQANHTPTNSELVFNKYGDSYFLYQIWVQGEQTGDQIEPSRTEQELEKAGEKASRLSIDADKVDGNRAGE